MAKLTKKGNTQNTTLVILCSILLIALGMLTWKYVDEKQNVTSFTTNIQAVVFQQKIQNSEQQATIIATTLTTLPSIGSPLYQEPTQLQSYITLLHQELNKDIVIVDIRKKILADTIPQNVGTIYATDQNNEVANTITDGQEHMFTEKSLSYPQGIEEVVIPLQDTTHVTVGAVILSSAQIH